MPSGLSETGTVSEHTQFGLVPGCHSIAQTRQMDLLSRIYRVDNIYGRYGVGWLIAKIESVELVRQLIVETADECTYPINLR